MKSGDALQEFNRMLKARGLSIATASASDGIDAMFDFYRATRADDCEIDADGDMLLFQWGRITGATPPHFALDITRQFIRAGGEDEDIWQLSLTFFFPPNTIASGHRWCHAPADLDDFASFVRSHPAYEVANEAAGLRVELRFECAG
jgi:hypothetical protein